MNKRLITLLLALCLMLSLVACGGSTTEEAPEQDVVEEETMPEEEVTEGDVTEEAPEVEETPEVEPEQAPVETPDAQPEQKPVETTPEVEAPPAEAPAGSVDLEAFYNELYAKLYPLDSEGNATGPFVQDLGIMPELLENYYPGLAALCKQVHVYMPGMSGVPYEVVLVEANSAADVDAVKALMQARIDTELANLMNYPMVLENWEFNSKIVANGNFVMMAVTEGHADYVDAFNGLF